MALFDAGSPSNLEDVLGRQAETASMGVEQDAAKKRRQAIAQQAASGRLRSGVANYTLADLDSAELSGLGGVESSLAESLGQIPTNDYVTQREFQRQEELANLIAKMNKRSKLGSIMGGVGSGAAAGGAVGGPWGAVAGGVAGGVLGAQ